MIDDRRPLTEIQIVTLVAKYVRERDRFEKMASLVSRRLSSELRKRAIPHVPTFRSKDPASLHARLHRDREQLHFRELEREFAPGVKDLAGVRILLYRPADELPTCQILEGMFPIPDDPRCRKDPTPGQRYRAYHRVVTLPREMLAGDADLSNLEDVWSEVQVVTFSDHIWNELEHDIVYKPPAGRPSAEQERLLDILHAEVASVTRTVGLLMGVTARHKEEQLTEIATAEDLRYALTARTGRPIDGNFSDLLRLLVESASRVTRAALDELPLDGADLERAKERLEAAETRDTDGVASIVSALWEVLGSEFTEHTSRWKGRPGPVARCVTDLSEASRVGRI